MTGQACGPEHNWARSGTIDRLPNVAAGLACMQQGARIGAPDVRRNENGMASDALAALTPAERAALRGRLTALLAGDGTPAADPATLADALGDMVAAILAERPAPVPGTNAEQYLGLETDPARRVVITGMGVITAAGLNVDTLWDNLVA